MAEHDMPGVTVTAETYGAYDGGPDVIAVHVDGREVRAYCIADDVEEERASMERMVRAIYAAGMREGAERMRQALRALAHRMRRRGETAGARELLSIATTREGASSRRGSASKRRSPARARSTRGM